MLVELCYHIFYSAAVSNRINELSEPALNFKWDIYFELLLDSKVCRGKGNKPFTDMSSQLWTPLKISLDHLYIHFKGFKCKGDGGVC